MVLPTDGYGDCEDYVLLKRKMLIDAGWPREALLITVVRDRKGEGHAVLTVKTDKGELVLDNQNENVVALDRDRLPFRQAAVAGRPECMGLARRIRPAVATASEKIVERTIRSSRPGHIPTPPRPRPVRARPALPQGWPQLFVFEPRAETLQSREIGRKKTN